MKRGWSARAVWGVGAVALMSAGGCSPMAWLEEKSRIDYRSERRVERRLEVPPDLLNPAQGERFALPERQGTVTLSAYQQQGTTSRGTVAVLPEVRGMRIERWGSERWLVVEGSSPEALWPRVRTFWQELGFSLALERPDLGILETDWAENRAKIPDDLIRRTLGRVLDALFSTGERDRFRTRLERGRNPGEVEIFVSHRGMVEVYTSERKEQTVWQPRPADPELEAEMLRRLMVFLGAGEQQARTALAAREEQPRAELLQEGGEVALRLHDPALRAWRRVGLALDRAGFTVLERNGERGEFRVRYEDPAALQGEQGFWSRLAFWRRDEGRRELMKQEFVVRVRGEGEKSEVRVFGPEGEPTASASARTILELLFEALR
ncbi:MAG: outer membrane protein assembly factor BamC [Hydrogenophilus sp.]|nr:outer membrane protein assembly factor BamC [Hydrogenophilus sp.]